MVKLSIRTVSLAGLTYCLGLLGFALILEHVLYYEVCPLCMLQRYVYLAIATVFLTCSLFNPKKIMLWLHSVVVIIFAILGLVLAGRQLWLQSLPPEEVPACLADLDRLLAMYSLGEALLKTFLNSGECAKVEPFLGVSLATWSVFGFLGTVVIAATLIVIKKRT